MKYIKTYEAYVEQPKFYRFTKTKLVDGLEAEITPQEKPLWGSEELNNILVGFGFPDKKRGIDLMDEVAYSTGDRSMYSALYGKNISEIYIDENAKLGWSFVLVVNEWYYKGHPYQNARRTSTIIQDLEKNETYNQFSWAQDSIESAEEAIKIVYDRGLVGTGTLSELMKSPYWSKEKVYLWTTDKVLVKPVEIKKTTKEPTPYKNEPVLKTDDFTKRGIVGQIIADFWKSDLGKKIGRMKDTADFDSRREEALRLLDQWIKTEAFRF